MGMTRTRMQFKVDLNQETNLNPMMVSKTISRLISLVSCNLDNSHVLPNRCISSNSMRHNSRVFHQEGVISSNTRRLQTSRVISTSSSSTLWIISKATRARKISNKLKKASRVIINNKTSKVLNPKTVCRMRIIKRSQQRNPS